MPKLVEDYKKFKKDSLFGIIGCGKSNISNLPNKKGVIGTLCMVGFAEDLIIWNIDSKQKVETIHGNDQDNVTFFIYFKNSFDEITVSIGYESGYVSVYSLWPTTKILSIKCHKHPITSIIYCDPLGDRIACGSQDTEISVINISDPQGYRMKGHLSPITQLQYIPSKDMLISSSQDGFIKFWFLERKHCFKTISNKSAVWDFVFIESSGLLITAGTESWLNVWKLTFVDQSEENIDLDQHLTDQMSNMVRDTLLGTVQRAGAKRVLQMALDAKKSYLALHTGEKVVEIFKLLSEEELSKRLKKKSKKAKKLNQSPEDVTITAEDRLKKYTDISFPNHCKSMAMFLNEKTESLEMLGSMKNNTIVVLALGLSTNVLKVKNHVSDPGHRTAVIYSQFTSDGQAVFTLSLSEAKVWNKSGFECTFTLNWPRRRMPDLRGLSEDEGEREDVKEEVSREMEIAPGQKLEANTAALLPGDRHVVIGFKVGVLIVYSLVDGSILQWLNAHTECVTSLVICPDKSHLFSSSNDTYLKLWRVEYGTKINALQLVDTGISHSYGHGISKVQVTPDNKTVVVATINSQVNSYPYTKLGKRLLVFYHHTQPVTCIAMKADNKEMLTGSGDKTVIKWTMEHAACTIFKGHKDAVTDVRYVPGRSMAFSCDRSGLIIQINLKNMTEITRLKGHNASITSLSILADEQARNGGDGDEEGDVELVSVSTDCSMRMWFESEEILNRDVEEEETRDQRYEEEELVREDIIVVGGPQHTDTGLLTKKTLKTERCTDELMEAMDNYRRLMTDEKAVADPKMVACGYKEADLYLLSVLDKIRGGDLEFVMAQLPMTYVEEFFEIGAASLRRGRSVLVLLRCLHFLATIHFKTAIHNERLRPLWAQIATYGAATLDNYKNMSGFNIVQLEYIESQMAPEVIQFNEVRPKLKSKKKKLT